MKNEQLPGTQSTLETSPPLSGNLLNGRQAGAWITGALSCSYGEVDICSAFLRSDALQAMLPKERKQYHGRILTRWQLVDLNSGASDLNSYVLAKKFGFKFFVRQNFHGKVFSIQDTGILIGSANATLSGLSIGIEGNSEACILAPPHDYNRKFIDDLFRDSVEIDDFLFTQIKNFYLTIDTETNQHTCWPAELKAKLQTDKFSDRLLTSECPISRPRLSDSGLFLITAENDKNLLGAHNLLTSRCAIAAMFKSLKVHHWLVRILKQAAGEMYFGEATEQLHRALLDDPAAYRGDVKVMLQTLLSWYELLPECGIVIDRPGHSQRIRFT
jgi:hypothetical protein